MKDGKYTVKKVEQQGKKQKVILKGVPKVDCIWSGNLQIRNGSVISVRAGKISCIKEY